jgi:hypothetical protein
MEHYSTVKKNITLLLIEEEPSKYVCKKKQGVKLNAQRKNGLCMYIGMQIYVHIYTLIDVYNLHV